MMREIGGEVVKMGDVVFIVREYVNMGIKYFGVVFLKGLMW